MTSFDVCSKIIKSDDRHPQPLDAQSWYLCKKESLGIMFDKWKSKALAPRLERDTDLSKAHVYHVMCHVTRVNCDVITSCCDVMLGLDHRTLRRETCSAYLIKYHVNVSQCHLIS